MRPCGLTTSGASCSSHWPAAPAGAGWRPVHYERLRLRCGDCGRDKLVGFSCKRRGFCPSCGARRMAQMAVHLVDHVIPHVPVRQWVLPLPVPLRLLLAAQPKLVPPVLQGRAPRDHAQAADWPHPSIHRFIREGLIQASWASVCDSDINAGA